jgi:glycosyltransferase involved in cell wall biosynthesis
MGGVSDIVTAYNLAVMIERVLQSIEMAQCTSVGSDVIFIDGNSIDNTPHLIQRILSGWTQWWPSAGSKQVATMVPLIPASATLPAPVSFSSTVEIFFPEHLASCYHLLSEEGINYFKTGVRLSLLVHPDWSERLENNSDFSRFRGGAPTSSARGACSSGTIMPANPARGLSTGRRLALARDGPPRL